MMPSLQLLLLLLLLKIKTLMRIPFPFPKSRAKEPRSASLTVILRKSHQEEICYHKGKKMTSSKKKKIGLTVNYHGPR